MQRATRCQKPACSRSPRCKEPSAGLPARPARRRLARQPGRVQGREHDTDAVPQRRARAVRPRRHCTNPRALPRPRVIGHPPTPSTACLGTGPLVCVKMNCRILIGAERHTGAPKGERGISTGYEAVEVPVVDGTDRKPSRHVRVAVRDDFSECRSTGVTDRAERTAPDARRGDIPAITRHGKSARRSPRGVVSASSNRFGRHRIA